MSTTVEIQSYKREILVGATDTEIVTVQLEIDTTRNKDPYLGLTGTTYDRLFIDEAKGEDLARDYLEDGEIWKMQVQAGSTEQSKEDFNDEMIRIDGWQEILGDLEYVGNGKYAQSQGCGQIDMSVKPAHFVKLNIKKSELRTIWHIWKKYHLKQVKDVPTDKLAQIKQIFDSYPVFESEQLAVFGVDEN